jgi:hypothetical protein
MTRTNSSARPTAEPLPQRDPGKTLRRTPATVGRPKPTPRRTAEVTR